MRDEAVIFGLRAALAVAAHRPYAIRRAFHDARRRQAVGPLLSATARERRPYREVEPDELARITGTVHHEGVAVVCDPLPLLPVSELLDRLPPEPIVVVLDQVSNPHNQGAILRSAAWFGVDGVIIGGGGSTLNPAAIRVAQGGAEVVPIAVADQLVAALSALDRSGVTLIGADQRGEHRLFDKPLPKAVGLVMGNEAHGLSPVARRSCRALVRIPGSGAVESLNVSVSAGILIAAAASGAHR